jgi:hypothetical protein
MKVESKNIDRNNVEFKLTMSKEEYLTLKGALWMNELKSALSRDMLNELVKSALASDIER